MQLLNQTTKDLTAGLKDFNEELGKRAFIVLHPSCDFLVGIRLALIEKEGATLKVMAFC